MSKIIVRRQEYANNGTHADEIEAVVQENLIANTLSSATDIASSVGLLKSQVDQAMLSRSTLADGTNLDSVVNVGIYGCAGSRNYTSMPESLTYGLLEVIRASINSSFITQMFTCTYENRAFIRISTTSGSTWNSWVELMKKNGNNVPSFYTKGVQANATTSITLSNNFRGRIDVIGGSSSNCFSIIASTTSTGVVSHQVIGTHSNITISVSTNTITLANDSGGANMTAAITAFGGSETV